MISYCMKHINYLLLYLFVSIHSCNILWGQEEGMSAPDSCIPVTDWSRIRIDTSRENFTSESILIASNRKYTPEDASGTLLNNELSPNHQVHYFLASCADTLWKIAPVNSLTEGLDIINQGKNLVLFVHGNGKTFPASLDRTARIKNRYNTDIVLFDWPAENFDLNISIENISQSSKNFQSLLKELKTYRLERMDESQNLSLFMHSLGNLYLKKLVEDKAYEEDSVFIDNLILNAAAIEEENHQAVLSVLNFQKRIFVVCNQQDFILFGAQFFLQKAMLGNGTNKPFGNANYIDFTKVAGFEHTYFTGIHQFEKDNHSVISFYFNILNGLPLNEDDLIKEKTNTFLIPE